MKRRDLLRHIEKHGCVFVREGQRHTIYENPANGRRVPIPRHREIPDVFAKSICRQLGVPEP
jgi:predicted RNA binding protein YcfA (HicA-like mRNA interferase family)